MKNMIPPWIRVSILITSLTIAGLISRFLTGSFIPEKPGDALIFQNAILLIVLGSTLLEYHYTKPADSLVNALTATVTLIPVYSVSPSITWWVVFGYCLTILVLSTICVASSSGKNMARWQRSLADFTYTPSTYFGNARLLYSIVFLFAVFTFYGIQTIQTVTLVIFWAFFIVIWPLGLPEFLSKLSTIRKENIPIGSVSRTDWPNIVRVSLEPNTIWKQDSPKVFQQIDRTQMIVMPLFQGLQGDKLVGTGLLIKPYEGKIPSLQAGFIYDLSEARPVTKSEIAEALGGNESSSLVGFAVEESTISEIRFEIWDTNACEEGMLVWCKIGDSRVYYQIIGGVNKEESFETNRQGFQIAIATQLGIFDEKLGFLKYNWLPRMNTPIFSEKIDFGADIKMVQDGDFTYGSLPGSKILVGGPFCKYIDHHTAILGVTGSGKTELAFDLIRHAVSQGVKVICIDLTSRYEGKLQDLSPKSLSLTGTLAKEIGDKLFTIETGQYGGYAEKKDFQTFVVPLRKDIPQRVESFLTSTDKDQQIGIITLEEISNTKATLWITELYLTCILHFAKNNPAICPKILLVVEEAHTVMPEPRSMGLGDFDSQGLVSKISQIALQGRKYGVGLLVIAQRTATVSKSILTQCNTVISFNCFDDTSLNFLSNVFGSTYVSLIPNLPFLHAIVFGKGIRSQRPLIIKIPYSEIKANTPS